MMACCHRRVSELASRREPPRTAHQSRWSTSWPTSATSSKRWRARVAGGSLSLRRKPAVHPAPPESGRGATRSLDLALNPEGSQPATPRLRAALESLRTWSASRRVKGASHPSSRAALSSLHTWSASRRAMPPQRAQSATWYATRKAKKESPNERSARSRGATAPSASTNVGSSKSKQRTSPRLRGSSSHHGTYAARGREGASVARRRARGVTPAVRWKPPRHARPRRGRGGRGATQPRQALVRTPSRGVDAPTSTRPPEPRRKGSCDSSRGPRVDRMRRRWTRPPATASVSQESQAFPIDDAPAL